MNTNPDAITVLCFGDSNTHGQKPDRSGRFAANERWTGILQNKLGDGYYIIEEGLGGRTTDLKHYSSDKPSRNGLAYFKACIDSHMPLDVVVIMLGTNDLKTMYNRSAEDVASALRQYPEYLEQYCALRGAALPKIILISPPIMDEYASKFVASMPAPGIYDEVSAQKSRQFPEPFKRLTEETGCLLFDAAKVTHAGEDGCHIDKASHQALGEKLAELLKGEDRESSN